MLWIIFALLTAAAMAAIVWPLQRKTTYVAQRGVYDQAVYRDQLSELERDRARGLIGPAEADAARNEIARRLLNADAKMQSVPRNTRLVPLAALAAIPILAIGIYIAVGHPNLPDVPRAERIAKAVETGDMPALIAKVEDHLAQNPNDAQGWSVLAPAYRKLERYADAADAYANLLRLSQPSADLLTDYAEMLVFANNGLIPGDAANAYIQALHLDPKHPKALYYSGLSMKQEGKTAEALAIWQRLLSETPADAPWRQGLERDIAALQAPGPTQDQVATAQNMSETDRQAMIRGMVDGLEAKLKENGSDIEGWQRLIRARVVLGDTQKASQAYADARNAFKDKPEVLASLEGLAKELGVK